jgi:flavin-dependent dehydrogenase
MKTYDVAVVGAGLAGLHTSRLLAESGLHVVLIDRKSALDRSIHTTGIFVRRTLEDFALPDDCLGPPVRDVTLYSPARRTLELRSPFDEFRVGRMGWLYERFLKNAVRAGVDWLPSTKFVTLEDFEQGIVVRLDGCGRSCWIRSRYIVGADGANSQVARALNLEANREWIVGLEEVFEGVPLDGSPRFHCFLDPRLAPGYLAWAVHDGEQVHIGVGGYPTRFDPIDALQQFRTSIHSILDLRQARLLERRGGRIPVGGVLRHIGNARGLLVGDAAGAVSPLTAGGLDPCLRLSTFAASIISAYLHTGDPKTLTAYNGELFRSRFISRLWMRRMIAAVQSPLLVEFGCAMLRIPLLDSFAWHVFFGRGSFPDLQSSLAPKPAVSTS